MKRTIALISTSALLVVGTAFVVHAQTAEGTPACADLTDASTGDYQSPQANVVGIPTAAGKLTWHMELAAPSCPDVQYGVTVFLNGADGESAPILGSASTWGDTISDTLTFQLEINSSNDGTVCVVQTTSGTPTSTGHPNGPPFDGAGSALLDRGPDGPAGGDEEPTGGPYCIEVDNTGSGGRTAG